jgi:hypothetical protein
VAELRHFLNWHAFCKTVHVPGDGRLAAHRTGKTIMNNNSISAQAAHVFTVIVAVAFLGATTLGIAAPVQAAPTTTAAAAR